MSVRQVYDGPRRKFVSFWRRTRLRSLIYAVFVFPIYLVALIIPKMKHEIYGSFSGQSIGDNALFAYLEAKKSSVPVHFISKSREAISSSGLNDGAVYAYSPRGLWLQLTARRAYFSHTIDDFFAPIVMGATVIALGHGVPMKKSAAADRRLSWIKNPLAKKTLLTLFPYLYHYYCNEVHSPSSFFDQYKLEVYGFTEPKLVRSTMPRIRELDRASSSSRKILFAPTFRKHQSFAETLAGAGLYSDQLQAVLKTGDKELWIKAHYLDEAEVDEINLPSGVRWLRTPSLNENLGDFSALITDYSSAFYDAHISGLAVGFVNHDLEHYTASDTELFEWFQELVADQGEKSLTAAIAKVSKSGGVNFDRLFDWDQR